MYILLIIDQNKKLLKLSSNIVKCEIVEYKIDL